MLISKSKGWSFFIYSWRCPYSIENSASSFWYFFEPLFFLILSFKKLLTFVWYSESLDWFLLKEHDFYLKRKIFRALLFGKFPRNTVFCSCWKFIVLKLMQKTSALVRFNQLLQRNFFGKNYWFSPKIQLFQCIFCKNNRHKSFLPKISEGIVSWSCHWKLSALTWWVVSKI